MKKFTKIMLKVAGIVACLGAICMVIAFAMGLTTEGLKQMARDGKFTFDMTDLFVIKRAEIETKEDVQIITEDAGVVLDASIKVEMNGDERVYTTSESFTNMEIGFGAGVLDVYYDDVEEVEIHEKNIDGFKVNVKNNTLLIGSNLDVDLHNVDDLDNRSLVVIIPTSMAFEDVDLEIGATQADINGLSAKDISVTIGAGQASISNITADNMELEVGAGQATVSNLTAEKIDVEAGLGQVNIELNGLQEDYNYNVECGMGQVVVGQYSYGGLGAEQHTHHSHATKEINVECGMGEVQVKFVQ